MALKRACRHSALEYWYGWRIEMDEQVLGLLKVKKHKHWPLSCIQYYVVILWRQLHGGLHIYSSLANQICACTLTTNESLMKYHASDYNLHLYIARNMY